MRKLIHSNFEIDLSSYKITDTEENPWFLDEIPLKFTFPFEIDLDDETDANFGFISSYQTSPETLYPLVFQNNNAIEQAELELQDLNGKKLTASLTYGLEQLPSWDKKLSELSLDNFDLTGETIYQHARTIISQTWPAVNYNFPMVHIDTIDAEEELWLSFKRRINDYNGIEFPSNYVDPITFEPINRNIIQPLPYALHILKQGLLDAGLTLDGEILTDERLIKKCIYTPKEYFVKRENPEYSVLIFDGEYVSIISTSSNGNIARYYSSLEILPGKYNILGTIKTNSVFQSSTFPSGKIFLNNVQVWSQPSTIVPENFIDIIIDTESNTTNLLEVKVDSRLINDNDYVVVDLLILPLELYDTEGNSIPTVINENRVDLTKAVPDLTFGEYFKGILNWYNYDYEIIDNTITMNKVEGQINYNDSFDLSNFEVKEPGRTFRKGYSYLLKFQDADNEFGYTFEQVFQSASGVLNLGFKTDDKTATIEINALPLPIIEREGVTTAHAFEASETKIYAVIYDGTTNGRNIAKDPTEILLPAVHAANWFKWFSFRINAQEFRWSFKAWAEDLIGLKAKGKAFAYGRYHVIKKIQKTEIQPDLFEVDIEQESLE